MHELQGQVASPKLKISLAGAKRQRYEICVIKEGNMAQLKEGLDLPMNPRLGVWVVLNNRTLSVFGS